jgi:ethylbenzene dioxygenase beta subunit
VKLERIDQLLFHEAYLLDTGDWRNWLSLLADDIRYWAPVRAELPQQLEQETERSRLPIFDETKDSLTLRVSRLESGFAWVEIPQTRTRRFIANIADERDAAGLVRVRSNFMLFRSRSFSEEWLVVGCREDTWSDAGGWQLKERKIVLDHCTLENLSVFL